MNHVEGSRLKVGSSRPKIKPSTFNVQLSTLLALSAVVLAACQPKEPEIEMASQYGYGTLVKGEVAAFVLPVRNAGGADLIVDAVSTSCGCTTARMEPTRLRPGESGALQVEYDSAAHPDDMGRISRSVFVLSNDPDEPDAELVFTVDVVPAP
jgi:hypothetical protein